MNAFASGGLIPERQRGAKLSGLVTVWDWYGTMASLAGLGDGNAQPCRNPTSPCFDARASAASLPPIDSYDFSSYLLGLTEASPRNEIPQAVPPSLSGR